MTTLTAKQAYFPEDVKALLGITSASGLRLQIKTKRLPEPDVQVSQRIRYWHRATLVKAGLLPPDQPSESSQSAQA